LPYDNRKIWTLFCKLKKKKTFVQFFSRSYSVSKLCIFIQLPSALALHNAHHGDC